MARGGVPFFEKAYGHADRDKQVRNQIDTRFRIGSLNKMFTSVAIAQLVERGKLKYTDPVARLLPDYPDKEIAAKITVHHLLTHTSGLGDFFGPEFDRRKDTLRDLDDYLPLFAGKPLAFEPGTDWAYSNAGMVVAGLVIERVSRQSYREYVRRNVYRRAGMKSTDVPASRDLSIGYTRRDGRWVARWRSAGPGATSAGGGDSTARDLLRFDRALRAHRLLGAALTTEITTGKVTIPGSDQKYAYGFGEHLVDGKRVVGHSGGTPGVNAAFDMYWDSGHTVVVLANLDPPIADQVNDYIRERIRQ
jgi:CubicO group peptidase (beta-lactamase class C family)